MKPLCGVLATFAMALVIGCNTDDDEPRASYVGRSTCAECHEEQTHGWHGSDHDRAMEPATAETVLGNFDDASLTHHGSTTRFFREGANFMVETEGASGDLEKFKVTHTFGFRPLQQYLIELDRGRVQCLTIAWDTQEKKWFSLYPDEHIPHDDVLHWTKPAQNWNYMCASCHSTDLQKNYDLESDTYRTTFAEIDVSCEACHGAASQHIAWARKTETVKGNGLLLDLSVGEREGRDRSRQKAQIETCARCHARRRVIHSDDGPDRAFLDSFVPELIRPNLYHADGQIIDEVYVYGSFLQSRMHHEGVACSDCHDPHSTKILATGNALCIRCHKPEVYNNESHHHHATGSKGALCVECHMRERTYMVNDPRRDHGFHIPRPDLTIELGVPNACNACHDDQEASWARDKIIEWYGSERPLDVHHTRTIHAGRQRQPGAEQALTTLATDPNAYAIHRATALDLLLGYSASASESAGRTALEHEDALVRGTAIRNVEHLAADALAPLLSPLLKDPSRFVRTEAARTLSRIARSHFSGEMAAESSALSDALQEYREGQRATDDQPGTHLNLAVLHDNLGKEKQAEESYRTALRIDPTFVPARVNLATLFARQNRRREAESELRAAISSQPEMVDAHYSLGLLLAEDPQRIADATSALVRAASLARENARIQYNAGLALQKLNRHREALPYLMRAHRLAPDQIDYLNALAILHIQGKRWREALPYAKRWAELRPQDPRARQLLELIQTNLRR